MKKLLEIKNLKIFFFVDLINIDDINFSDLIYNEKKLKNKIPVKAVDDVSFDIYAGEVLGIAGESGSGKSVTSHSIINLIPSPAGKILGGEVLFKGVDVLKLKSDDLRNIRGKEIGMIFHTRMVVQRQNYQEIEEFYEFSKKYGADQIQYTRLSDWNTRSKDEHLNEDVFNPDHAEYESACNMLARVKHFPLTVTTGGLP